MAGRTSTKFKKKKKKKNCEERQEKTTSTDELETEGKSEAHLRYSLGGQYVAAAAAKLVGTAPRAGSITLIKVCECDLTAPKPVDSFSSLAFLFFFLFKYTILSPLFKRQHTQKEKDLQKLLNKTKSSLLSSFFLSLSKMTIIINIELPETPFLFYSSSSSFFPSPW